MIDGLDGLRHYPVVCGDHEHCNVRHTGTAGADGGKGRVAGRVNESDRVAPGFDLVGAHMLGYAAKPPGPPRVSS